ncbi:MAG: TetR/AcrR family transcriptional regulator [Saprospiraceae bacterium]
MAKHEAAAVPTSDSTEQKIFDAAHEVFSKKGMDGSTMQEIADRAGINKALLHYYYRSKDKLYEMVARAILTKALSAIRHVIENDLPLEEKIRLFIETYIGIISRNTFIPLFILSEISKHPDRFFETILPRDLPKPHAFFQQVENEISAGRIRPIRPQHLIVNIISMCVFPFVGKPMVAVLLGLNQDEMRLFLKERTEEVTTFVLAGLRN